MDLMEIIESEDVEDFEFPSYSTKGDMVVCLGHVERGRPSSTTSDQGGNPWSFCKSVEIIEYQYDGDSAIFWIQEGIGFEYWLEMTVDGSVDNNGNTLKLESDQVYVIEGVHGDYIRGDGWTTDDDEDWYFDDIRVATIEEIAELFGCSFWDSE